jgi:threonine dehydrogenase-like Zn-dependent dehydrogenase
VLLRRRSVLGIINRDGCMAQWLVLPERNLLRVPSSLSDELAVFCEPLAAACRILEQGLLQQDSSQQVAVVGGCPEWHAILFAAVIAWCLAWVVSASVCHSCGYACVASTTI